MTYEPPDAADSLESLRRDRRLSLWLEASAQAVGPLRVYLRYASVLNRSNLGDSVHAVDRNYGRHLLTASPPPSSRA